MVILCTYMLLQKQIHNFSPKVVDFDGAKFEIKEEWEEEYLETSYYRIKKTLELLEPKPKDKVLEIGCDSGLFALIFKERFKDISEYQAVEVEQERVKTALSRGISVARINVEKEKLPFGDNYFDVVLFGEVIEHLLDPLLVLSEIKRVIKSTGAVIVSTPNAVGLFARYNHLIGVSPHHPPFLKFRDPQKGQYGVHRFEYTRGQLKDLLEDNGYKIEEMAFSRFNHQRRGMITKIVERLSLSKSSRSDMMIFKCRVLK